MREHLYGIRLVRVEDAARLAGLRERDAEVLRSFEPVRPADFATPPGQAASIGGLLDRHAAGQCWPGVITLDDDVVGTISLNNVLPMPLSSAFVGYWVASAYQGRGAATSALRATLRVAALDLRLHRVDAFTQVTNRRSQAVLERAGFERIGVSREHILLGGAWRDEVLWQRLLDGIDRLAADDSS